MLDIGWHFAKCANDRSKDSAILAEGVEPRLEAVVFVTAVLFVESLGLCVVVLVDGVSG